MTVQFSITSDLAGQTHPVEPLFETFAAAGFSAVHWCHDWLGEPKFYTGEFAENTRQLADRHGLRIADVHGFGATEGAGITFSDELFAAINVNRAEFAARVGAEVVVVHLPPRRCPRQAQAIEQSIAALKLLRPACETMGVRVAVENLPWPTHTYEFLDALFDEFDAGFLGFCFDSGHAILTGQDDLVDRYGERLVATHLHDNDSSGDHHHLPGTGLADWPRILSAIDRSNYTGTINLEVHLPDGAELGEFCSEAHHTIAAAWRDATQT